MELTVVGVFNLIRTKRMIARSFLSSRSSAVGRKRPSGTFLATSLLPLSLLKGGMF